LPASREAPKLAYREKGSPVIIDIDGTKKYVYSNGSIDTGSIVSSEVEERAFEIGSIAAQAERIVEEVAETDMGRVGAADLYGLHGEELDNHLAAVAEVTGMPSPIGIGSGDMTTTSQPHPQAA
jgi:hypothetical protein